ncbi:MAG: 1,4-dihydroxy-2-naphthoate prenyltransferase [Pseudonocardiaceae bacterium]|nr:1,4-dihydroxy-2-naphthoate prenyltransferase [Pseudonocardiaceae bacterium]
MIKNHYRPALLVPTPLRRKAPAYVRLAKLDIFDYYLGLLIVWSLLPAEARLDGRVLATLALFLLSEISIVAATVSFDDVTGYRDGSDAVNYGPDAPARRLARKPLLTQELTPAEATRFGWVALATAVFLSAAAIAVAPAPPTWAVVVTAVCLAAAVQWSWGLKLSHHGFNEAILAGVGVGWLLAPYGLITGAAPGFVVVQALVFGMGPLLFGVYSNTNDVTGDAKVGRWTAATMLSARGNAVTIAVVSLLQVLLIVGAPLVNVAPWWFPLAMLPIIALRARQLDIGVRRHDILVARKLGITTHRTAVVVLVVVNLVYAQVGGGVS